MTGTTHVEGETIKFKLKKKIISEGRKGFRMETNEQKVEVFVYTVPCFVDLGLVM